MKYNDAIKQLQAKQLKSVYLITGEELYLAENYLKKLLTLLNPQNDKEAVEILMRWVKLLPKFQELYYQVYTKSRNLKLSFSFY